MPGGSGYASTDGNGSLMKLRIVQDSNFASTRDKRKTLISSHLSAFSFKLRVTSARHAVVKHTPKKSSQSESGLFHHRRNHKKYSCRQTFTAIKHKNLKALYFS